MNALHNLKKNITPKARMMLGLTVVGLVGVIGATAYRLASEGEATNSDGAARLNMPPSKEEISKDKPLDAVRFDDNTTVGQLYKKDEVNRAEEALKSGKSHVDDIRLRLEPETVKATPPPAKPVEPAQSRLEMLKAERRKTEEAAKREQQSSAAKQATMTFQENPWKSFLDTERSQYTDYETALSTSIAALKAPKPLPSAAYEALAVTSSKTGSRTTSSTGYESYLSGTNSSQASGQVQGSAQRALRGEQEAATPSRKSGSKAAAEQADEDFDYPSERIAKNAVKTDTASGLIPVGKTAYSVLQIGVNTDEISPIRAVTVEKGRLEGAVLTGEPKRTGEKALLAFTSMSLNGRSYNINAIALDPDTYRSAIADNVDNHTFERYSKLFLSAFVEGYGDALSGTQTTTNTDGSSSQVKDPLPDTSSQIKVGIGEVGRKMSPIFEREFDRPPTVTVEPNKSIIIMFMQEVNLDAEK